jgi:hypothetical protein
MITVYDYVSYYQPDVAIALWGRRETVLSRAEVDMPFAAWKAIMEERPKPGLGGLLEGEKAV